MTVRQLLAGMDSRELSEWLAFSQLEPLPDPYWPSAMMASTMANLWTSGKRYKVEDFLPRSPQPKKQTPEEMRAVLNAFHVKTPRDKAK